MEPRIYNTTRGAAAWLQKQSSQAALFAGDCSSLFRALPPNSVDLIVTSPPYCMGKAYENGERDVDSFVDAHRTILPLAIDVLKPGASMCWQLGYHVRQGVCTPLDYLVLREMEQYKTMFLRNRIAWTFGHGLHANTRFSGRHETVLWFTKGKEYKFNLDAVRVVQKYQGKRSSKGLRKGEPSGNPNGKNPSDVWEMPNVNSNHVEKTEHPCQFPIGLAQRLVRCLTPVDGVVLDPFCGVGSAGAAALIEGRRFLGAELDSQYVEIAATRMRLAAKGKLPYRPADRAVHIPEVDHKVVKRPDGFAVPYVNRSGTKS